MPVLLNAFPIRKLVLGVFQLYVIGQSNPSPYRLIWKKFLPLYKTVYSRSSRKQGWSVQKKNIYKSHLWCQMNEMWTMNHVEGWAGSAFHYHNWPTSLFALTVLIPLTHFKLKIAASENVTLWGFFEILVITGTQGETQRLSILCSGIDVRMKFSLLGSGVSLGWEWVVEGRVK